MRPPTIRWMSPRTNRCPHFSRTGSRFAIWPWPAANWMPGSFTFPPTTSSTVRPAVLIPSKDRPHPLGAYGVSKLAGELYAQAYLDKPLIIRTSGVFGPGGLRTARGNFIELMLRLAASKQPIRVVEDHVASPTYAPLLAARTAGSGGAQTAWPVPRRRRHAISWFDYAAMIFRVAGLQPELRRTNEREYRTAARRPKFSALSNSKMEASGIEPMPPLESAIEMYLKARESYFSAK